MKNSFKGFIEKQYNLLVIVLTVLFLLTLVGLFSSGSRTLTLLPGTISSLDSLYEAATYSDHSEPNGNSKISPVYHNENSMKYTYTINNGVEYPYAGLSLFANITNPSIDSYIDISKYSDILLDISAKNSTSESLIIRTIIPGFTKINDKNTRGFFSSDIPLKDGVFHGKIPLENFGTPDWWYTNNKVKKSDLPAADFSQVVEIVFQNGYETKLGSEVEVVIRELSFVRDVKQPIATAVLVFLLVLTFLSSVRFIKFPYALEDEGDGSEKIVISYDRVEIEDEQNNDLQRITDFIASNYSNPDFSVEQLAKGAGVSTSRIPTLLKKHYSMNFKQYLNTVRITEAKRLLLETDHQIVTIAHSVGYNNIPHFNRTFKQVTGLSPKKYRETPDEAIDNLPGTASNKE